MIPRPTTTVAILRGIAADPDEWGSYNDDVPDAIVATGVPAAVVEDSQVRFGTAELRAELVEQFTVRVPHGTDVREGDRLLDANTADVYTVNGVSRPQTIVGPASVRLITKRTGAGG